MRVSEVMESDVFGTNGFQDFVMGVAERIRVEHGARFRRGEHVGISRMFLVFLHQQVYRLLRDCQRSHGILRLGLAHYQLTFDAVHLLGHGDGPGLDIQVSPEKGQELAPPQARGQLHVEEVTPYLVFPHGVQKCVQFFVGQDTFRCMACLWHRCAHGGIFSDDMRVEGVLHRLMEDGMEAVDGGVRQSGTKPRMLPDPAVLFQPPIELLHILRCHQRHLLAAELRLDVVFQKALRGFVGRWAQLDFRVVFHPDLQPTAHGVGLGFGKAHELIPDAQIGGAGIGQRGEADGHAPGVAAERQPLRGLVGPVVHADAVDDQRRHRRGDLPEVKHADAVSCGQIQAAVRGHIIAGVHPQGAGEPAGRSVLGGVRRFSR